jgi:hypothetical protein
VHTPNSGVSVPYSNHTERGCHGFPLSVSACLVLSSASQRFSRDRSRYLDSERFQSLCHVPARLLLLAVHVPPRTGSARWSRHVPGAQGAVPRAPHGLHPGNFAIVTSFKRAAPEAWVGSPTPSTSPVFSHTRSYTVWGSYKGSTQCLMLDSTVARKGLFD